MANYRIVNPVQIFLNNHCVAEKPRDQLAIVWQGEQYPDQDQINEVACRLQPVQLRHLVDNALLWQGFRQPGPDDVAGAISQAPPPNDYLRQRLPLANIKDVFRKPELRIQRPRLIKCLGWKTLARVGIKFDDAPSV